ncbi:hypothetical protein N8T08_010941 [Aspergillus melleus]|uniref:Uncharacterized protein n=1 Tax=Aspergillus melleus TaxID=138277 RepID=A0ACC3AQW0_9EURO|nr:hypothetical protein N8T08_010941 [Aspergillus melleus]
MSFQTHHRPIAYSSPLIPPLSDIIGLEPEIDRRCAGIAPSQGRRCRTHTNQHGRSSAMMLLHQGTKDLRVGRSIDPLLTELGPHVLCWRHKDQASGLEKGWSEKVRAYLGERGAVAAASTSSRRSTASTRQARPAGSARRAEPARFEPARVAPESAGGDTSIDDLTILIVQAIQNNIDLRRRVEEARGDQYRSVTAASSSPRQQENSRSSANTVVNSASARGSTSSGNTSTSRGERVYTTARRPSTETVSSSEIARTVPRSMQAQGQAPVSRARAPASVSSRSQSQSQSQETRPATSDTATRGARSAEDQVCRDDTPQVQRREVEGECGICLCELRVPQHDGDADDEEESDHSDDEDHDDGYDQDDDDDDDDDNNEHQNDELVWCKARCGVNFHKPCIDQWLEVAGAPTCPACRSIWSGSMRNARGSLSNFDTTQWL